MMKETSIQFGTNLEGYQRHPLCTEFLLHTVPLPMEMGATAEAPETRIANYLS